MREKETVTYQSGKKDPVIGYVARSLVALLAIPALFAPYAGSREARASANTIETLRAVTRVAGSRPTVISVRLPAEATVKTTVDSSPDIKVSGRGRFVGFALVPEDPKTPVLLGGRLPESAGSFRVLMPVLGQASRTSILQNYSEETTLPPGRYRLYFLPGAGHASVTLNLHGLSGKTVLRPSEPARYELLEPDVYSPNDQYNYYSAGSERNLRSRGLIFQALWLRVDAHLEGVFHFCTNGPENPAPSQVPPQVAYGPGCAGAGGGLTEDRAVAAEPHVKVFYEGVAPLEPADYGQGFYFATASKVSRVGHLAMWLSYD